MKNLLIFSLLVLYSDLALSSEYQNIINQYFENIKILEKTDFDMQTINSQLPPSELKRINGMFSLAIKDYDGNGLTDFVALTYNKNIKPKLTRNYYYREYYLIICLQYKKYSCEKIKNFTRGYPLQYYLSAGNLHNNLICKNKSFKKGMPAFFLEPALGNIWEWGIYYGDETIMCAAGD